MKIKEMTKSITIYRKEQAKNALSSNLKLLSEFLCLDIESMPELEFYTVLDEYARKLINGNCFPSIKTEKTEKIGTLPILFDPVVTEQFAGFKKMPSGYKNFRKRSYEAQCLIGREEDAYEFDQIVKGKRDISFSKESDRNLICRAFLRPSTSQAIAVVEKIIKELKREFRWMSEAPILYTMDYNGKLPHLSTKNDLRNINLDIRSDYDLRKKTEDRILRVFLRTRFSFDSWMHSLKSKIAKIISDELRFEKKILDSELTSIIERAYMSKGELNLEIIKKVESSPYLYLMFNSPLIRQIREENQVSLNSFRDQALVFPTLHD
jgi:hypothetical protein